MIVGASVSYSAPEHQLIPIEAGETKDVYFEINLAGSVYLSIRSKEGLGCANFWWIVWPFGAIKDIGEQCGNVKVELPGLTDFAISAKLRARASKGSIRIIASSSESIAYNFPPVEFP